MLRATKKINSMTKVNQLPDKVKVLIKENRVLRRRVKYYRKQWEETKSLAEQAMEGEKLYLDLLTSKNETNA